jgi:hypothetical protein
MISSTGTPLGLDLQLARGFLDEGARAAAAGRLHVHLLRFAVAARREEQRFHILAADLGDEVHVGMQLLYRRRDRHHLLDELAADQRCNEAGAGAGQEQVVALRREPAVRLDAAQELEHHLGLLGVVALVVLPQRLAVARDHRLDGRRADVESDGEHQPLPAAMCSARFAALPATP